MRRSAVQSLLAQIDPKRDGRAHKAPIGRVAHAWAIGTLWACHTAGLRNIFAVCLVISSCNQDSQGESKFLADGCNVWATPDCGACAFKALGCVVSAWVSTCATLAH